MNDFDFDDVIKAILLTVIVVCSCGIIAVFVDALIDIK